MLDDKFKVVCDSQELIKMHSIESLLPIASSVTVAFNPPRATGRILCLNHKIKQEEHIDTGSVEMCLMMIESDSVFLFLFAQISSFLKRFWQV